MSRDQHPSVWRPTYVCTTPGCVQPAAARLCYPQLPEPAGPGQGFVIIRPAGSPVTVGDLACLDCAHAAVDDMLMRALPAGSGPALEQRPDGAP